MLKALRENIIYILALIILSGCAGPKFLSDNRGSSKVWNLVSPYESISIRMLKPVSTALIIDDKHANQLFAEILAEKIRRSRLYHKVIIISSTETAPVTAPTPLLIEAKVISIIKKGWASRAIINKPSEIVIAGRLVDVKKDRILLTFDKIRSGQGGILGGGGLLTVGGNAMVRKLMEWVADDIVKILQKGKEEM